MPAWPTTDPVENAFTPVLSNGRVVIVYNSDVSWSLTLAQRYAKRKRIPLSNLFGYAFGSGIHWMPANTSAIQTMTTALEALFDSVGAQCVLLAPGCPNGVEVTGVFDSGSSSGGSVGTFYPSAVGYPDLAKLCSGVRQWNDWADLVGVANMHCDLFSGTDYAWSRYRASPLSVGHVFSEYSNFPSPAWFIRNAGTLSAYQYPDWEAAYWSSSINRGYDVHIATQALLNLLGETSNRLIPYGRIGCWWNTYGVYPQPDPSPYSLDFDTSARWMEAGMRYAEACSPDNRYRSPIHYQLQAQYDSVVQNGLAYQAMILRNNGYSVTYTYTGAQDSYGDMESWCPSSGQAYTTAELVAGRVVDHPYHLTIGIAYPNYSTTAESPYLEPYKSALKPTGGGGSALGPSFGYGQALTGMSRGGASGLTNASHITSGFYTGTQALAELLLRGLTWAEASFFSHECGQQSPPIGDPLARPFPV